MAAKQKNGSADLIKYIFSLSGAKPDVQQFKLWATQLKRFTEPDDEDIRSYTIAEMKKVIDYLHANGVNPILSSHLFYDALVAYVIDEKLSRARAIVDRILKEQSDFEKIEAVPNGW